MSNLEYINYRKLEVGDQVSWEHPVTGKVYDFEVTEIDRNDDWQPVELQLLDDLEHGDVIIVSEYAEFPFKGARRWPYISNRAYKDRYGWDIPENSITLDCLFYSSMHHVPKSAETEEIENGRILAHRALMEDLTTVEGDGSSEIALVAPEVRGELNIPSADDYNQPFMSAEKARELAENSVNIKERVSLRIEDAAKSGEFETYLTDEEFKICKSDLVEHNYEVSNNRVSWGDQGDWGDYDA